MWWSVLVIVVGGAMVGFGPGRVHDVFGDGTQLVKEWKLTEAVTKSGIRRLPQPVDPPVTAPEPENGTAPDIEQDTTPPAVEDDAPDVLNGDDFCET